MKREIKSVILPVAIVLSIIPLLVLSIVFSLIWEYATRAEPYATTDTADYGNYIGNNDNERASKFINSFFPKEIEDSFSEVQYSYRAQEGDTCAFEAYLEFVIEDTNQYNELLASHQDSTVEREFSYDSEYTEYVYYDRFMPSSISEHEEEKDYVNISFSEIGKVLFCDKEQRIIYVALGVHDGGIATTDFLNVYFRRFNINPKEYKRYFPEANEKSSLLASDD